MDKSILIEYSTMREEVKDLRRRIDKIRRELDKLNSMVVSDSVTCGKKGKKPLGTVKIHGLPTMSIEYKQAILERNKVRLEAAELELLELTNQAEEYIETIEKSELRIMFRLYFIDDLPYVKVAQQMNMMFPKRRIKYTDENIKKKIQRFFQNVPQCPEKIC